MGDRPSAFRTDDGSEASIPLPDSILDSSEFRVSQRIKHVMAAVRVGLEGGPDAETAAAYVAWMARRQIDGGAAFLDLNVDEIDHDVERPPRGDGLARGSRGSGVERPALGRFVRRGRAPGGPRCHRPDVGWRRAPDDQLRVDGAARRRSTSAASAGCPSCSPAPATRCRATPPGGSSAPRTSSSWPSRRGCPSGDLYVDTLVIPIGVDPEAGNYYLDAVRFVRDEYGPDIHITGGVSNVSFGLPARRLISDVFLDLCVQAGQDSGIVDPVAADIRRRARPRSRRRAVSARRGHADRAGRLRRGFHRCLSGGQAFLT